MPFPTPAPHRLTRLIETIYAIVFTLRPLIDVVGRHPLRPYAERERLTRLFSRILQQLLGLTARIDETSLAPIRPTVPRPSRPAAARAPQLPPVPYVGRAPVLAPRSLARRLAALLRALLLLAAEVALALPPLLQRNIRRAQALAGCFALQPRTWEQAG